MFRELMADEIECRVSQVYAGFAGILLYKTARTDMDLLDETVGPENWKVEYQEIKGNLYCGLSVKCGDEWITKWNCGIESKGNDGNEKKGEASDAMKRAGFCWGIGRELYTAPAIFIECSTTTDSKGNQIIVNDKGKKHNPRYEVAEIEYVNRKISKLVITEKGKVVYRWQAPDMMPEAQRRWLSEATQLVPEVSKEELVAFAEKVLNGKIPFNAMSSMHLKCCMEALRGGTP